jgi:hypothetical protein
MILWGKGKGKPRLRENIHVMHISDKGFISGKYLSYLSIKQKQF